MKTEYNHISKWERKQIEELTQAGNSNRYPRVELVVFFALRQIKKSHGS